MLRIANLLTNPWSGQAVLARNVVNPVVNLYWSERVSYLLITIMDFQKETLQYNY